MPRFNLDSRNWLDSPERKRDYNRRHFAAAAAAYDRATVAMSLGRDRAWKRRMLTLLPDHPRPRCLDLACGTGDICELLARRYPRGEIVGLDLTCEMLELARRRVTAANVRFVERDMAETGFADASFDIITGSYALRNAPDLPLALNEIRRLLKPGGQACFLDFARAGHPVARRLQYLLLRSWCGLWGRVLSGSWQVHGYIAESLARYPDSRQLAAMLAEAGLERIDEQELFGGMMRLLLVRRPAAGKNDC
ncbi:demethylmenaquinone methyltransferase [Geothermobacter ehrlichii]|uniref:Demethylmenaquinone methyltransferase n=1 Tax=Geothermobacter ehrlichii TaxID=213224 RepID=A0A5D3WP11_9BACT|nr:ubiquinone/menaquinone biosynthesis methyltransferase [Geothermobacter ehrlichii]TYO99099.1 demethylmenaquinone methyltransferase [Geothermobacter ehrlichii]